MNERAVISFFTHCCCLSERSVSGCSDQDDIKGCVGGFRYK